jgi:hypothetical protein
MATLATAAGPVSQTCDETQPGTGPTIPNYILVVNPSGPTSKIELKALSVSQRILHLVPSNGSAPGLDEITVVTPPGTSVAEKDLIDWIKSAIAIWDRVTGGGSKSGGGGTNCTSTTSQTILSNGTTVETKTTVCTPA